MLKTRFAGCSKAQMQTSMADGPGEEAYFRYAGSEQQAGYPAAGWVPEMAF